jgi:hypothetical protein
MNDVIEPKLRRSKTETARAAKPLLRNFNEHRDDLRDRCVGVLSPDVVVQADAEEAYRLAIRLKGLQESKKPGLLLSANRVSE